MPSGAKKRKAAKKKKQNQPSNHANPTTYSHGDDVKHHEDQESDVGDINSPSPRDRSSHQNIVGVVQVHREIKVDDASNSKNGKIEISEPTRNFNGDIMVQSSSSSSSDDESNVLKNSSVPVIDSTKADDSISETLAKNIHSSVKEAHVSVVQPPSVEKIKESLDLSSLGDNSVSSCEVDSQSNKNGVKYIEDKIGISAAFKGAVSERKVDGTVIQSVGSTAVISDQKESVLPQNDGRSTLLNNGVKHAKDSEVTEPLLNPTVHLAEQKTLWKSCCGLFELFTGSGK